MDWRLDNRFISKLNLLILILVQFLCRKIPLFLGNKKPTLQHLAEDSCAPIYLYPVNRMLSHLHLVSLKLREGSGTHSSTLAWKIPWMEEPGGLQSIGSLGVGHNWATSLSLFTFMHWRRKWQPTPVFLPGESQGPGSLVGCRLWGRTESDTTEAT